MATELSYDLCPETGIGCVLLRREEASMVKLDLMPDEAAQLKELAAAGDIAGIRALLSGVSATKAAEIDDSLLEALVKDAR